MARCVYETVLMSGQQIPIDGPNNYSQEAAVSGETQEDARLHPAFCRAVRLEKKHGCIQVAH